ncbi:HTH domain protein [Ostertagia ostertagi]
MDRTERFYKIEHLIRSRGCVSFATLLEALEVSPATLKRDLAYLRERLDAPIEYDAADNGYRFGQQWRGGKHELPGVWFNEAELHALLDDAADAGRPGRAGRGGTAICSRCSTRSPACWVWSRARRRSCAGASSSSAPARRRIASDSFETVGSAVVKRKRLTIRYRKKRDGASSEREVSPQRLVHHRHAWYLDAWCHASNGYRRFALDGIESAALLETDAKAVPLAELEAELDQRLRHLRRWHAARGGTAVQPRGGRLGVARGVASGAEERVSARRPLATAAAVCGRHRAA